MNILLIAATAKEIEPFLQRHRNSKKLLDIDILITGIGLTSTTYHLVKQLQLKQPGLVIQAGVAGCFDEQLPLGSVVIIKQDTIADESVVVPIAIGIKKLKTLFDLELVPQDHFPYSTGWLVNSNNTFIKKSGLKTVRGISVNQITSSKEMIAFYKNKFNPVTESMEGAAIHYVCLMEKIPFLQLRSISNYIGERNKKKWNMKESIINLNTELIEFIKLLDPQSILNNY
jgi:futalosine hydrolase